MARNRARRVVAAVGLAAAALVAAPAARATTAPPAAAAPTGAVDHLHRGALTPTGGQADAVDPARGLRPDLMGPRSASGPCEGGWDVRGDGRGCVQHLDPAPEGSDVTRRPTPAELVARTAALTRTEPGRGAEASPEAGGAVLCFGTGAGGPRVQAVYAYPSGSPDRSAEVVPLMRQWAKAADKTVNTSAAKTGGERHIRWATTSGDATCQLDVAVVELPTEAATSFGAMVRGLRDVGFARTDRHYLTWVDAATFCGLGELPSDDQAGAGNWANTGPFYARVDSGCWGLTGAWVEVHELFHTLGAVQDSTPNASGFGHCTDEYDLMCYPDGPGVVVRSVCTDPGAEYLLDCSDDDYFSTAPPPGSYLANNWNTARSVFLADAALGAPILSVGVGAGSSASVVEGTGGSPSVTVRASLSKASTTAVSATVEVALGSATAADLSPASVPVTFPAGTTSVDVPVAVVPDALDEADETFVVSLRDVVGAGSGETPVTVTIVDDDDPPTAVVGDAEVTERPGRVSTLTIPVTLSTPSGRPVSVAWSTLDGSASAPADYAAWTGQVSFAPGTTNASLKVKVLGDVLPEGDETFRVRLSAPVNLTLGDPTGVITVHDPVPQVSVADLTVGEGSGTAAVRVSLDLPSVQPVNVRFTTADASARNPADYAAATVVCTIPARATEVTVPLSVAPDALDEVDETFKVLLSSPTAATVKDATGIVTITDDDPRPSVGVVADVALDEPAASTATVKILVRLSAPSGQSVSVAWRTEDASAAAPADYLAANGVLTFPAGTVERSFKVSVKADEVPELSERFNVRLSTPVNASIDDGLAAVTVTDPLPTVAIADATVNEGTGGNRTLQVPLSLTKASARAITVGYASSDGKAKAPGDYAAVAGTLTIPAGTKNATIPVAIVTDAVDETAEAFSVTLAAPTNAVLGRSRGVMTITDDDGPLGPSVSRRSTARAAV